MENVLHEGKNYHNSMGEEEVKQVLYAVGDNHGTFFLGVMLTIAYLRLNCEPVSRMRDMLHQYFKPNV